MLKKFSLVAVFAAVTVVSLSAAPWMSLNTRRVPKNLVVVGNYKTPRLMAATIKGLTSQPYLVITADGRYFVFMAKSTSEIPADKLDVYINRLNPKRIVIIGDERYVSRQQEDVLRRINLKRIPLVRIYGGDWGRVAEELDDLLNIGSLAREFRRNYFEASMSDVRLRVPSAGETEAPAAQPAVPADAAEPAAQGEAEELPASEPTL